MRRVDEDLAELEAPVRSKHAKPAKLLLGGRQVHDPDGPNRFQGREEAEQEVGRVARLVVWEAYFCVSLNLDVETFQPAASSREQQGRRRPAPVVARALEAGPRTVN